MRCENKRGDPSNGLIRNSDKYSVSDRNWSRSLGFSLRRKKASLGGVGTVSLGVGHKAVAERKLWKPRRH